MLQLSYNVLDRNEQLILIQHTEPLLVLQHLAEEELKLVEHDLYSLTPGPDLTLQYAIAQQRRICLIDLIEFFKILINESTTGE